MHESNNYPAGAYHDPRAPWNQPDACEACGGEGFVPVIVEVDEQEVDIEYEECEACGGTGDADYVAPVED